MRKIKSLLSGAILTIMRNATAALKSSRTNRTYMTQKTMMTTKTRVRDISPIIGKEKNYNLTPGIKL